MLPNGTSVLSANPWSFWGKPTGDGQSRVTLEPNVGPPESKKPLEGMEPEQPGEQFAGWEQLLERVAAMRRDQAEAHRQLLEGLQDLTARQTFALGQLGLVAASQDTVELPTSEAQEPLELPTPKGQDPSELPSSERQEPSTSEPRDPSELPTSEPRDPSELPTSEPQEPPTSEPRRSCRPPSPTSRRHCRRPLFPGTRRCKADPGGGASYPGSVSIPAEPRSPSRRASAPRPPVPVDPRAPTS